MANGIVCWNNKISFDELKVWSFDVGYFLNHDVPNRDYTNWDTFLSLYPDNEEMLIIYNIGEDPITITLSNTVSLPGDMIQFTRWDLYDDTWGTVVNSNFIDSLAKNITESLNFSQENKHKYQPIRKNHTHKLKIFPRHPLDTPCMFAPKLHMTELRRLSKDLLNNHASEIPGFLGHATDKRYCMDYTLNPKTFIAIDQIITQWKIESGDPSHLSFVPLWYKTKIRKHFNYSV